MAPPRYDWAAVQRYHDEGHDLFACRTRFGFCRTAWRKAIARGAVRVRPDCTRDRRRRYDWKAIQAYYDAGHSYGACRRRFGFSPAAWYDARRRGEINSRPLGLPLAELLGQGKSRYNIKQRLIRSGMLRNRCEQCGLAEWRGKPLSIQIDHINGVGTDHRLENLRMLCPNCHSQTETYGGNNKKLKRSRVV